MIFFFGIFTINVMFASILTLKTSTKLALITKLYIITKFIFFVHQSSFLS